jgi:hypothetical protein
MMSQEEKDKLKQLEESCGIDVKHVHRKKLEVISYIVDNVEADVSSPIAAIKVVKETFDIDELAYLASIYITGELADKLVNDPLFAFACRMKRNKAKTNKDNEEK